MTFWGLVLLVAERGQPEESPPPRGLAREARMEPLECSWVGKRRNRNSVVVVVTGKVGLGARPCARDGERVLETKGVKASLF